MTDESDRTEPHTESAVEKTPARGSWRVRPGVWLLAMGFVVLLLLLVAVPRFIKARTRPSHPACLANLKRIDAAKEQWALVNQKKPSDPAPAIEELRGYLGNSALPACPAGGAYSLGRTLAEDPVCSLGGYAHSLEEWRRLYGN